MNGSEYPDELVEFFKALADANRLKIIGLLAREPMSGEQIAGVLGLHTSTVSHHLSRLSKAGLVSARAEGYYSIYQLEIKNLEAMAQRLLSRSDQAAPAPEPDVDEFDRKVLKAYLGPDGRVKDLPNQQKKQDAILRYVVKAFEPGVRYTEKQVNAILSRYNEDTARFRRALVDAGLLQRQASGGEYWLAG